MLAALLLALLAGKARGTELPFGAAVDYFNARAELQHNPVAEGALHGARGAPGVVGATLSISSSNIRFVDLIHQRRLAALAWRSPRWAAAFAQALERLIGGLGRTRGVAIRAH